ncbi:MAG: hypothetical protein UV58_C0004G0069 [Candidatus Wolfebacteria bacterium GW2011_GWC1_43_10]|uniref:TVP38/TMEM64 family membrane protein n=1 Tax=Candidatus Wolfebacteria bacterium GW2011_GWC1_43_10 TaxID=1619011 RepID=A0A0G1EIN7_9BACT|nr:MAG: hypothetical protein UV58_C0004G0069 [Candidatus Wolfebacteria bacterium GW2011_GWC1_43_10]KKT22794.1 MAG: hypothetical protein UW08_C0003G0030 [Parcubacteria group bacterium GW2011_GWB1_43_8b]
MSLQNHHRPHLKRDLIIIAATIVAAILLTNLGVLSYLLSLFGGSIIWAGFLAGLFFASAFTAAPSIAIMVELAKFYPAWEIALFGGIGALVGDSLIFRFIKDSLVDDAIELVGKKREERIVHIFHPRFMRWLMPFLGALIIASPLPDEVGLAIMGFSRIKAPLFAFLSFFLNSVGILAIVLVAQGL